MAPSKGKRVEPIHVAGIQPDPAHTALVAIADPKVRAYPPEAVLTIEQVAAWLQISKRTAEKLHIPCLYLGTRTRRYVARDVLKYLDDKVL
jgi:hypothetical protein